MERSGALRPEDMVEIMLPVLDALQAAHEAGVVHRDLKPENIFLACTRGGQVHPKILDFGISKVVDAASPSLTKTSSIMGTPAYMAPEQAGSAKHADHRSDQYSIGAVLSEASTGRCAFEQGAGISMFAAIVEGKFPRPSDVDPAIDRQLEAIILRAMALKPVDRFLSAHELGDSLAPFGTDRTASAWRTLRERTGAPGPGGGPTRLLV